MQVLVYDGSFAGLLTAVFDVYEYKYAGATIVPEARRQDSIFATSHMVYTDEIKAQRVWKGLEATINRAGINALYRTFLSEQAGMEDMLLRYMQYAFLKGNIGSDYSHEAVRYVTDTAKKVHREKHRMEAFVRFQLTKDNLYYATVEPDFNVLPLIEPHFRKRYADQRWLIYDVKRKYGLYYDLKQVQYITLTFNDAHGNGKAVAAILDETEEIYQQLWQKYFASVNIASRKNMKLHIQHMPRRYWKYLPEKQPR
ncbi:MAG: TIGR03915 family putative DNA repair protein [Bacteroidota bacterium]